MKEHGACRTTNLPALASHVPDRCVRFLLPGSWHRKPEFVSISDSRLRLLLSQGCRSAKLLRRIRQLTARSLERDDFERQLGEMRNLVKKLKDCRGDQATSCTLQAFVGNAPCCSCRMSCTLLKHGSPRFQRSMMLCWASHLSSLKAHAFAHAPAAQGCVHGSSWIFLNFLCMAPPAFSPRRADLKQQNQRLSTLSAQLKREMDKSVTELQRKVRFPTKRLLLQPQNTETEHHVESSIYLFPCSSPLNFP